VSVTVTERDVRVDFDRFDLEAYDLFLRAKRVPERELGFDWQTGGYSLTMPARFAPALGAAEPPPAAAGDTAIAPHLFDFQRFIVEQALAAKRYAIWADTGLGKTAMQLEWARQVVARTGGRVVLLAPLQVIGQTVEEAERFYGDTVTLERLGSREELAEFCAGDGPGLGISNHEKLTAGVLDELRRCAGLVVDESSILKSGGGVIKWNLIKSARGVEYKLSCTATPAPNDTMEYASQAAFLEKLRSEGEILWTYFSRDKRGTWYVKPHAREAFYRFMASWSIYLRDPASYGFADILSELPPPVWHEHRLEMTEPQRAEMQQLLAAGGRGLFDERQGVRERAKLSQLAKGFLYEGPAAGRTVRRVTSAKPDYVAYLVEQEVAAGRPTLVWTVFDEESERLERALAGTGRVAALHGSTPPAARQEAIDAFRHGQVDVLVSKAQLVGYGLNFQQCRAMVFSGFDDSFERMYQAVRRAYRFGQTETVHVHVPVIPELEGLMLDNLKRKQAQFERDVADQEARYRAALAGVLP
jgi:hypothetical protein